MKLFFILLLSAVVLISCKGNEPSKPSTQTKSNYLAFFYKLPTDSTYLNFRLIFSDTISAGYAVYPRVYTKNQLNGDTIFVSILNKQEDTVYAETSIGYTGYQLDMVSIKPNSTQPFHGFAYYIKGKDKVLIYDRYFIMK